MLNIKEGWHYTAFLPLQWHTVEAIIHHGLKVFWMVYLLLNGMFSNHHLQTDLTGKHTLDIPYISYTYLMHTLYIGIYFLKTEMILKYRADQLRKRVLTEKFLERNIFRAL